MKIFKIVLTLSMMGSGYIGYTNYQDLTNIKETVRIEKMESPTSMDSARDRVAEKLKNVEKKEATDYSDIIIKVCEALLPLLAPVIAARKKKDSEGNVVRTVDDEIGDLAIALGVSRGFIKGKLGLGDDRRKQIRTKAKRRATD